MFAHGSDGRWLYRAAESGERVVLAQSSELDIDAIFAGVFELPGDDVASPS